MKRHYFFLAASLLLISCGSKQAKTLIPKQLPSAEAMRPWGTHTPRYSTRNPDFRRRDAYAVCCRSAGYDGCLRGISVRLIQGRTVHARRDGRTGKRVRPDGTAVWNVEDDDTYMFERCADEWLVSRRGKVLYASTGCENKRQAEFVGKQGEALSAIFFTTAGLAQIRYDGVDYLLRQYVTASGYGYKNPFVDIRGKGQDMTLTFSAEGKSIAFTEKK